MRPSTDENATAARRMEGVWGGRSTSAVGGCAGGVTLARRGRAARSNHRRLPRRHLAWLSKNAARRRRRRQTRVIGHKGPDTLTSLEPPPLPLPPAAPARAARTSPCPTRPCGAVHAFCCRLRCPPSSRTLLQALWTLIATLVVAVDAGGAAPSRRAARNRGGWQAAVVRRGRARRGHRRPIASGKRAAMHASGGRRELTS